MKSVVRSFVPAVCTVLGVLALGGCSRTDRDRTGGNADPDRGRVVDTWTGTPKDGDKQGTTTITGANVGSVGNQAAIDRIVSARCAREVTCNNVGGSKTYANPQACSQKLKSDMKDDLNAKECAYGVDQKELNECLEEIRKEACDNPIDAISRFAACRTSDLCLKTGAPNR